MSHSFDEASRMSTDAINKVYQMYLNKGWIMAASEINAVEFPKVAPRESVLNEAASLITGERNQTYGSPTQNFTDIAGMWSIQLRRKLKDGATIDPGEVASMMILLKLCRMIADPKRDNWTDTAGYAGCGYEADVESGRIKE